MASELAQLIENELKAHGYEIEEDPEDPSHAAATETSALLGTAPQAGPSTSTADPEAAAHTTLMGALRVEVSFEGAPR